jgi:hypothetical protein
VVQYTVFVPAIDQTKVGASEAPAPTNPESYGVESWFEPKELHCTFTCVPSGSTPEMTETLTESPATAVEAMFMVGAPGGWLQEFHWQASEQSCVPSPLQDWVSPGVQAPCCEQAPKAPHAPLVQVRDFLPHFSQGADSVAPEVHSGGGTQIPQAHCAVHVCVPPPVQDWVLPESQAPWPVQALKAPHAPLVQVRDFVPHFTQGADSVVPEVQSGGGTQIPQAHSAVQVWVPLVQGCVVSGAHTPPPVHALHEPQLPLTHVWVWVPVSQLPQGWEAGPVHVGVTAPVLKEPTVLLD